MSLPVHLVESLADVAAGSSVEVTGDEAHHAVAVRRLRVGEHVMLTDGAGSAATGTVDLIALATHGRGGWTRLAVGSVADKVLRGSNVPVLVFRPAARPDGIAGSPGPPVSAYA